VMKMGSEGHSEHASLETVSYIGLGGLGMVIGDDNLAPGHIVLLIDSGHDKVKH
jgi:hypothetical protein